MAGLWRYFHAASYDLTDTDTTTAQISYMSCAMGNIYIPAGSSITRIDWYVTLIEGDTPEPLYDDAGAVLQTTVAAGQCHPIPTAAAGAAFLHPVIGAGTTSGAAKISMKG